MSDSTVESPRHGGGGATHAEEHVSMHVLFVGDALISTPWRCLERDYFHSDCSFAVRRAMRPSDIGRGGYFPCHLGYHLSFAMPTSSFRSS